MLWVLVAISSIEMAVVHMLLLLWLPWLGAALSIASVIGIVWIVRIIRSMPSRPVLLDANRLLMRVGTLKSVEVPLGRIAGLRADWDATALRARGVAKLSLLAYRNVVLDLAEPVRSRRGRQVRTIAHRLDDPIAFAAAFASLKPGHE